jgi:hypothetical protein
MDLRNAETFGSIEADNDDLLLDCFEDHEAYISAKNHKRFVIIGRKGSGKTAIFRRLTTEKSWNHFSYGHSFSNYPWFFHDKQKKSGVPDFDCYRYSWEYIILISIARIIVNQDTPAWSDSALEAMSGLETFLVDTYGSTKPELNKIFSPATKLKFKPSATVGWGPFKGHLAVDEINIEYLPTVIYEVNEALTESIIKCLNPNYNYYVCFDELDRGFVADDENYRQRLIGLLLAVRDFNKKIRSAEKKMSAIVFLRDDILRSLQYEDSNKLMVDFSSLIEWDKSSTSRTLMDIMERRFSKVLDIPQTGAWNAVFNEEKKMPGLQSKYQHIVDRTFKRPRDIINFSNEILRVFKQDSVISKTIDNRHIVSARKEHSNYVRAELSNEMHKHFPSDDAAFDMLRIMGRTSFSFGRANEAYEHITRSYIVLPPLGEILRELYNFSVIGFLKVGGLGGGSEWTWKYEETRADYDERATIFRVHSSLKENLGLVQGRATAENEVSQVTDGEEPEPEEDGTANE